MGEARQKKARKVPGSNGHPAPEVHAPKQIRVVSNIKLQNVVEDGVTMMLVGEEFPELAVALPPAEAKQLIAALTAHLALLEQENRRIILPGEAPYA